MLDVGARLDTAEGEEPLLLDVPWFIEEDASLKGLLITLRTSTTGP